MVDKNNEKNIIVIRCQCCGSLYKKETQKYIEIVDKIIDNLGENNIALIRSRAKIEIMKLIRGVANINELNELC